MRSIQKGKTDPVQADVPQGSDSSSGTEQRDWFGDEKGKIYDYVKKMK